MIEDDTINDNNNENIKCKLLEHHFPTLQTMTIKVNCNFGQRFLHKVMFVYRLVCIFINIDIDNVMVGIYILLDE